MSRAATSGWQIRAARLDDAAEIARLTTELGYPATTAEISSRLAALLPLPDRFIAVAAAGHARLLGWIAAEPRLLLHYDPRAEIIGLVVGLEARRCGVGRALVSAAEAWAAHRGLPGMVVHSNAARSDSHPFYEGIGFRRNKTQHYYIKELTEN